MRIDRITPELVELAPRVLQPGRLYISEKYRAAVHLCCCGCGEKVVTPLSPAEWQIKLTDGRATLRPSIGNWSMACQSHYFIRDNRVVWSGQLSRRQIKAVFERDLRDLQAMHRDTEEPRAEERSVLSPVTSEHKRLGTGWRARLKAFWQWLTR
ncbi:DUF6527 family protein [Burkholderia ubonensis]|uniref:DUF6527 family protein n=1 Tax=Burkholderia ubonensis TaxID=101571 RepID=UPI000770BC59|nr:DUF6527 family protein [Burkholderia ubonensis]KVR61835.1 hypothetical protein WK20_13600 [Burkholderia ubonensis]